MAGADLKSIVDRIVDLPTLPQVVTRLMALIEDPKSSARQIDEVMRQDPALAAKILKLVNSSFYGLPNRVTSIRQAITILGYQTLKSLAISASVFDLFAQGNAAFSYEGFWRYAIACAAVSSRLAKNVPHLEPETAFVAGLLHGIGKLILDQYAPVEFQEILARAVAGQLSFAAAEEGILETGYAEIGFWLAERWNLAEAIQLAIRYQDRVGECPESARPLAAVVAFAVYLLRMRNYGCSGDYHKPTVPRDAWNVLGLTKENLPALIEALDQEIERSQEFFTLIGG